MPQLTLANGKGGERLQSPYPFFGGKSAIAHKVWKAFGDVSNFIEPFFGSGAVLLNRPAPFAGVETVNDIDGLICNFWRAVTAAPSAVAKYADWPVNENDVHARHIWLVNQKDSLQERLEGDPDYYNVKIAGWWVWGICCWIGGGFCSGEGPWHLSEDEDGCGVLVKNGQGEAGVNRRLVHLSNTGQGVNRKRVHLSGAGQGVNRKAVGSLVEWMQQLAARLKRVRVCCGDWTRVCGGKNGDALGSFFPSGQTCAIFLDPPYSHDIRDKSLYRMEDGQAAEKVREWAIAHGEDKRLRIVLCGYDNEHSMPANWDVIRWKAQGGMSNQSNNESRVNAARECLWLSPHCVYYEPAEVVAKTPKAV